MRKKIEKYFKIKKEKVYSFKKRIDKFVDVTFKFSFLKKTSFSIEGFYNLRLRLYLFFGDYKKACEDVNSALNYLVQNEDKHYNLLARLERGIETSLMYLQEAIIGGEEFCAKHID